MKIEIEFDSVEVDAILRAWAPERSDDGIFSARKKIFEAVSEKLEEIPGIQTDLRKTEREMRILEKRRKVLKKRLKDLDAATSDSL